MGSEDATKKLIPDISRTSTGGVAARIHQLTSPDPENNRRIEKKGYLISGRLYARIQNSELLRLNLSYMDESFPNVQVKILGLS